MPEACWKLIVGVIAALFVTSMIYEANHSAPDLDRICDNTIQLLAIPLGIVGIVAAALALNGDGRAPAAIAVAAVSVLAVALLNGEGAWATPLAIAVCVAAFVLRPRASAQGDVDRANDCSS
ncbi:MAG: hypothetical protein K8T90_09825 [Planctomycetes bacterium]|nr:hypothetical protein [Planctomycetota bacterium]